ncbi:MAG: helix-turn-helix transcriptional regulator [Neisseria sp.]|nr:helix-turn-helix transcriptional regulator [Neisseria sp.]
MIDTPELGYTPNNLKLLRQMYRLTQQRVADITGVGLATAQRWEANPSQKSFANMPHTKWLKLLEYLKNK